MLAFKEIRMGVLYTQGKDIICLEIILQYLIGLSLQYRRKLFVFCFVTIRLSEPRSWLLNTTIMQ